MKHYPFILFYLFCNVFIYAFQGTFWVYLFCFLMFLAVVIWGSFDITLGYFINSITHKRTKIKEVALTFDDGPTEFTPKFLDVLKESTEKIELIYSFLAILELLQLHFITIYLGEGFNNFWIEKYDEKHSQAMVNEWVE